MLDKCQKLDRYVLVYSLFLHFSTLTSACRLQHMKNSNISKRIEPLRSNSCCHQCIMQTKIKNKECGKITCECTTPRCMQAILHCYYIAVRSRRWSSLDYIASLRITGRFSSVYNGTLRVRDPPDTPKIERAILLSIFFTWYNTLYIQKRAKIRL
jgi:hypothetical protein